MAALVRGKRLLAFDRELDPLRSDQGAVLVQNLEAVSRVEQIQVAVAVIEKLPPLTLATVITV